MKAETPFGFVVGVLVPLLGGSAVARDGVATNRPAPLPGVVVVGKPGAAEPVEGPFLPEVQGTKINAGKKTTAVALEALPLIQNNNYRQALARTPGLLLSEETSPLISIGYRGLNPHRVQFTQVLQDGIPIHADPFGYPEAYYTPPLESVERIELVRGGASLMYGPQPGGALNYVTRRPRADVPFAALTRHVFGSDAFYSTFNAVEGTVERLGYSGYFHHRQTDGFRDANSDVALFAGNAKLVLDPASDSRWVLSFDGYAEEHGEPGGLTFTPGPNAVLYNVRRDAASRRFDRFRLERHFASLGWERDLSEDTLLTASAWGGYYSRFSKRQRGGGFGTLPSGPASNSNTIEHQQFWTQGGEARLRHDWTWGANLNTLAAGAQFYHTWSPRTDKRGATPDANDGPVRNRNEREVFYAPVFVENRFVFGNLSVTPGLRLENLWQHVREKVNLDKAVAGTPLGDERQHDFVPLFGVGTEYQCPRSVWAYGNFSQAYRPKLFTQSVPLGANTFVNEDLKPGHSWQADLGVRGRPVPYLHWDASLFWMEFNDQIGSVAVPGGTSVENVGDAVHRGMEAAIEVELFGLADALRGESGGLSQHQLSLYANVMWLEAEFVGGPQKGNTPQYAPEVILRAGAIYRWGDRVKLALTGTMVEEHFADDANSAAFRVAAYAVWDLTLEWKLHRRHLSVVAGINNLLDEDYYARITGTGIDPAYRRNFYAGLTLAF